MNIKLRLKFLFLLVCFGAIAIAPNKGSAASGSKFLETEIGARAVSLGSAYTGIARDASALFWNPAGLGSDANKQISANYMQNNPESRFNILGYTQKLSRGGFGAGVIYLHNDEIEGRNENRIQTNNFSAHDLSVLLGYSYSLSSTLRLGANGKFIESKIASYVSRSYAFDFGIQGTFVDYSLDWGFSIKNVGPRTSLAEQSDPLPLAFALGGARHFFTHLLVTADAAYKVEDKKSKISLGSEYLLLKSVALRAGYTITESALKPARSDEKNQFNNLSGLGLGLGIILKNYHIDYSFSPNNELSPTQSLTLSIDF